MTVEIREVIIKTEVRTREATSSAELSRQELNKIKSEIIKECIFSLKKGKIAGFRDR